MKIAFCVDASSQIGTGHFMRSLTLTNALRQRGAQIRSQPLLARAFKGHVDGEGVSVCVAQ
ncbi:MAG: hypothetical protein JW384_01283 [Nitrosomonadaceae bacterium]|nr:hypothetical protein [Nitrosomonadaceae bacterium]